MFDAAQPDAASATTPALGADDRTWGAAAHLAALIPIPGPNVLGPLVIWLARRGESAYVDDQGRESVNFQLSMLLLWLATIPLLFIGIGFVILWLLPILNLVFVIWAALKAAQGEAFRYPFNLRFLE